MYGSKEPASCSSGVDAVDAALRVVLLGQAHGEDLGMLTRLVDQV